MVFSPWVHLGGFGSPCGAGAKARVGRCEEFCLCESESLVNLDLAYSVSCIVTSVGH